MDKMMKFIDIYIPVTECNLNCHYCYISDSNRRGKVPTPYMYDAEYIGKALSVERLGGLCHFNMCGWGETMLSDQIVPICENILKQGHYIWIVTNGLITKRFEEMLQLKDEYLERLGFKFSFHYLELKKRNLLDKFFETVALVKQKGCSYSIEVTPSDELYEYKDEVKQVVMEHCKAMPHITVPRIGSDPSHPILSKYSVEEFQEMWRDFNSDMFDFKMSVWGEKREEFCYAGQVTGLLNIGNGMFKACYASPIRENIFEDIEKPIHFRPVGHDCQMAHCFNSHAFLSLGTIPQINTHNYLQMRNRVISDQEQWVNHKMAQFIAQRLDVNHGLDQIDK